MWPRYETRASKYPSIPLCIMKSRKCICREADKNLIILCNVTLLSGVQCKSGRANTVSRANPLVSQVSHYSNERPLPSPPPPPHSPLWDAFCSSATCQPKTDKHSPVPTRGGQLDTVSISCIYYLDTYLVACLQRKLNKLYFRKIFSPVFFLIGNQR